MAYVPIKNFKSITRNTYDYTLDDLEADDQFQEVSERFLESIGEQ